MDEDLAALLAGSKAPSGAFAEEPWGPMIHDELQSLAEAGKRVSSAVLLTWLGIKAEKLGREPPSKCLHTLQKHLREKEGPLWDRVKTRR